MQILGKKSKVLLIAVAIVTLVAVGISFAMWDIMSTVKASNGNISDYANAKVGDIVEFGRYYQTGNRINNDENAEYEKTPIEWLVVDKDERTGQLTLMSKYILAAGSYFGNWYYNYMESGNWHYNTGRVEVEGKPYNQAYVESTVRAYLNNIERRDLGGDSYSTEEGYKTSISASVATEKLQASVGFSNRRYTFTTTYIRPINNAEYRNRPATRGFYDEAFTKEEKAKITQKTIPGYIGYRWPVKNNDPVKMSYVEGCFDKVWIPSVTELNIMAINDAYTNPSDEASSTVFEYFKSYNQYKNPMTGENNTSLAEALQTVRTPFVTNNSKAMNYSIPVYKYQSTDINEDIHETLNSTDIYWTRSPRSDYFSNIRCVLNTGSFYNHDSYNSYLGVRPCIILKY